MSDRYWMGKPIKDLPREELIAIIGQLADDLDGYRTPESIRMAALGRVEMLKRGLKVRT